TRMREARNEAERKRLADRHEYNRNRAIRRLYCSYCRGRIGNYNFRPQAEQVHGGGSCHLVVGDSEAIVDLKIVTNYQSELAETLLQRGDAGSRLRIIFGERDEHADAPHRLWLLCARRERPSGGSAADKRDELTPPHSITSSARVSTDCGMVR